MGESSTQAAHRVRLARSVFVALTREGALLPKAGDEEPFVLTAEDLVLLEHLAREAPVDLDAAVRAVVTDLGLAPDRFDQLVTALRRRGGFVPDDGTGPGAPRRPAMPEPASPSGSIEGPLILPHPRMLRPTDAGFEVEGHDGRLLIRLSAADVSALLCFRLPATVPDALEALDASGAVDRERVEPLVARALGVGVLHRFDPDDPVHNDNRGARDYERLRDALERQHRISERFDSAVAAVDAEEREHRAAGGAPRVRVVPVDVTWSMPPLALGLLVARARAHRDGALEESYLFHPRWYYEPQHLEPLAAEPAIYLFSNYLWNHEANLAMSARVKELNPASITIHGGPNTPKYEHDCEEHFRQHPHVDVTVRGEGEATFVEILEALAGGLDGGPTRLDVLADVPGLTYRTAGGCRRTADRDRIAELGEVPSPLLAGLFDDYGGGPPDGLVIETNRGCPYGCTFCDWGSATLSRIRKFDLDRVYGELEWVARNRIKGIMIADANFGIFERDVEIAEKIAELKATYGYPELVGTNYAKNTVKHLQHIIQTFARAGIVTEGIVSLQSMDQDTLLTIKRKNIKVEKYNDLADEFRRNSLPLTVELMMGLPGSTAESFRYDLQQCINRDVRFRMHVTQMLPNSPMNDPAYRAEHGIQARPGELVTQTSTYTNEEYEVMLELGIAVLLFDVWGVLRHFARYVRRESGVQEMAFYEHLMTTALADPDRWPALAYTVRGMNHLMMPPISWKQFLDEVRQIAVADFGLAEDEALDTAVSVQHALLPAADRTFPDERLLAHDFAAWHGAILEAIESGHRDDWEAIVPPLREYPPAPFTVDDPDEICQHTLGQSLTSLSFNFGSWELRSPLARARLAMREAAV